MPTCPYCGGNLDKNNYCSFCVMEVDPVQDRQRKSLKIREFVFLEEAEKSTPELMTYPTFELLYLLRLVRKERSFTYGSMNTFHKAVVQGADQYQEIEGEQGKGYFYWTKKAWVIENIIRDRMGYVPNRISDNLLASHFARCQQKLKPMYIRTKRREGS